MRSALLAALLVAAMACRTGRPAVDASQRILVVPDRIVWRDAPSSLRPGAKMIVLEGDPTKDGFFTMRLLLPDGYRVDPHWHPKAERLTIISGTLNHPPAPTAPCRRA